MPGLYSLLKSKEFIGESEQNAHLEFHSALWYTPPPPLPVLESILGQSIGSGIRGELALSGHVPKDCSFPCAQAESEAVIQRQKGQQEPSSQLPGRISLLISSSTRFLIFLMLEKSHEMGDLRAAVPAG